VIPYHVNYFAKEELFEIPVVGWYIRRVNAFPVNRNEADVGAVKTAQRILEAGEGLVLFPEGGRRRDPKRQWQAKSGVGLLACTTERSWSQSALETRRTLRGWDGSKCILASRSSRRTKTAGPVMKRSARS